MSNVSSSFFRTLANSFMERIGALGDSQLAYNALGVVGPLGISLDKARSGAYSLAREPGPRLSTLIPPPVLRKEIDPNDTPPTTADDPVIWSNWLLKGGNPNLRDFNGITLLQKAINDNNLDLCRVLIDHGAAVIGNPGDIEKLMQMVTNGTKLSINCADMFMAKRTISGIPELFIEEEHTFRPITQVKTDGRIKPLAIINISSCWKNDNGFVMQAFQKSYQHIYEKMGEHFTLVRDLSDDVNELPNTIDRVKALFPNLPLFFWGVHAHTNGEHALQIGKNSYLRPSDTLIMQEIAKRIHPLGTITLFGCSTGNIFNGIAPIFAENADDRITYGASQAVLHLIPKIFNLYSTNIPRFYPLFQYDVNAGKTAGCVAFRGKERIGNVFFNIKEAALDTQQCILLDLRYISDSPVSVEGSLSK